jgi:cobalamin biosynthesis protein CobD/CbiB
MWRSVGLFIVSSAAVWLPAAILAWFIGGSTELLRALAAYAICAPPAAGSLVASVRWMNTNRQNQAVAALAGTPARLVIVCLAAAITLRVFPELDLTRFGFWLVSVYLLTLALEVRLLISAMQGIRNSGVVEG